MTAPFADRYAKEFLAGWGSMDFNGHMANSAYLNLAADVRMAFFAEHGFAPREFRRLALGPVMCKDELEYFREIGLHETVTVTHAALAMSPDGARFVLENEIWSAAGERAATVKSTGGWLDLRERSSWLRQTPCSRCSNRCLVHLALSLCRATVDRDSLQITARPSEPR